LFRHREPGPRDDRGKGAVRHRISGSPSGRCHLAGLGMKQQSIKVGFSREPSAYEIVVGDGLLSRGGEWVRRCLGKDAGKIVIISNPKVFGFYGKQIEKSLRAAGFPVSLFLM